MESYETYEETSCSGTTHPQGDGTWTRSEQLSATREQIKHFTPLEVAKVIIDDYLNPKNASDYAELSPKILKEFPKKAIIHLTRMHYCNTILRSEYIPEQY
ncbi:Hypothetical protein CINCED_3A022803 [Cinara cedri]|uniref:Uncharacterized protein n=1 Tax=Cinara cedri TaxID=506608 RepID=A0A5E4NSL3_9HEMI|nr:Hypothetical protein CINCED_3A022803 [Cinara cedri]